MNREYLTRVLLSPHVSEKSTAGLVGGQHVFKVLRTASKIDVKKAVEILFDVKVSSVRLLNVRGKSKRVSQEMGCRKDWKKAYIRLVDGHAINLEGESK